MNLDPSGWIPNSLGTIELQANGVVVPNARPKLNFAGATITDDGERLTVTFAGAGSYDEKVVAWLEAPTFDNLQDAVTGQELASLATAQTFTNKTFSLVDNSLTVASGAAGDLLVHNGTKYIRLAKGSALQVLRVNAGATNVEWAAPSGSFTPPTGTGLVTVTGGALDGAATSLGTGVLTFLSTPSSANLLAAITDETGTGALVFGTAPTFNTTFTLRNPADTFSYIFTPSAIVANRTLTLPLLTANDTLVCAAFTQTLTNKTIDAASNTLSNIANANISASAAIAGSKVSPDFSTQTCIVGGFRLTEVVNSTTGTINDLALAATTSVIYFNGAGTVNLTGMTGGAAAREVTIINMTGNPMTIPDSAAGSAAANRFLSAYAATTTIQPGVAVKFIYSVSSTKWHTQISF